ncbi:unnamed protein product [Ilex paraguariensis]|uniref:Uncharacterized protein n=1 Tax=Ilex paraguariensis TaxID=185542 RepID=A0ABC8V3S1_9AQUA
MGCSSGLVSGSDPPDSGDGGPPVDEDDEDHKIQCQDEPFEEAALEDGNHYHSEDKEDFDAPVEFEQRLRLPVGSNGFDDVNTTCLFSDESVQRHERSTDNSRSEDYASKRESKGLESHYNIEDFFDKGRELGHVMVHAGGSNPEANQQACLSFV